MPRSFIRRAVSAADNSQLVNLLELSVIYRRTFLIALGSIFAGLAGTVLAVTPASKPTVIQVKAIHCATCAKKIAKSLYEVEGVKDVKADINKNLTFVAPDRAKAPSPRAMWEAVEAAGFQPLKLSGPSGTYTSKPKS